MSVLYRKYRSKSLDELVGQDHIVTALKNSISSGKIAHAYLLTGPRGTGKTSVARIIAHAVNGIKYDENTTNLDIIEIDAASNRRIDEIRDLRDKVHIAPTILKYKVYIIDEVHMLTKEAFNALLKTLEEPPAHVIFILATTELQKVPDTIISRTQRYAFKPIGVENIVSHLSWIADKEAIPYQKAGLEVIAEHAEGGFRDAIGLLDQVRHTTEKVTADAVMLALGTPPDTALASLWQKLSSGDTTALDSLNQLFEAGYHAPQITKRLLRQAVARKNVRLAKILLAVGSLGDAKLELQLLVIDQTSNNTSQNINNPINEDVDNVADPSTYKETTVTDTRAPMKEPVPEPGNPIVAAKPTAPPKHIAMTESAQPQSNDETDLWEKILTHVKEGGHSVYGPLRLATATFEDTTLRLGLAFPFHIKRVNDPKNLTVLTEAVTVVTGKDYIVVVEKMERKEIPESPPSKEPDPKPKKELAKQQTPIPTNRENTDPDIALMTDPLSIVKNVFGGAEVL